jgi:DNA-binding CsgD family transcriptional regulator
VEAVDEAAPWTRTALAAAEASGDPNAELDAIRARVMLDWRPGRDDEVWELGRRAIGMAEPTGRPLAELWARVWRHDSAVRRADMAAAQAEIAAMQALADCTRLPLVRWHVLRRLASLAVLTGSFDSYRRLARQATEIAESWQDESARNTHFGQTVCLALLRGDPSDLAPGWTDDLDRVAGWPPVAHTGFAGALLLVGRRDEAQALYEPVVPALLGAQSAYAAASVAYLVELAPAFGDAPACRAIRDWIDAAFGQSPAIGFGTVFYQGSVARMMGQLEVAAGEPAAAIAHFEEGLQVDGKLGARPHVARGRMGLAQALSAIGDRPRAVELARAAAADARRLDMPGLLRTADAFLAEAAATARAEDPLTAREHQVVELVAQALSNRDIAGRLVLSERTVESHIRRILAKTGFTTRTELTRWYLQQPATDRHG